jgi:hypothetical protein
VAWESATILIKDAEDQAALVEREARDRVSRLEVESAVMLTYAHKEAKGFAQRIALLEGELADAC